MGRLRSGQRSRRPKAARNVSQHRQDLLPRLAPSGPGRKENDGPEVSGGRQEGTVGMMEAYALAAVALLAAGAVIGFLAFVSLGTNRDDAARSMLNPTSDRVARGARIANGVSGRGSSVIHDTTPYRQDYLLASHEVTR